MFAELNPTGPEYARTIDALASYYRRNGVVPLAWVRRSKDPDDLDERSDVFGEIVQLGGSFSVGEDGARVSHIESLEIKTSDGQTTAVQLTELQCFRLTEPLRPAFGVLGFFRNGVRPSENTISTVAMRLAARGHWSLVHAIEYSDVHALALAGDLRPEGMREPVGYRWKPIAYEPLKGDSSECTVRWGLVTIKAEMAGKMRREELFSRGEFCRTNINGVPCTLEEDGSGKERVILQHHELRRPRRLVTDMDQELAQEEAAPTKVRLIRSKSSAA